MFKFIKGISLSSHSQNSSEVEADEPDTPPVLTTTVIVVLSFVFVAIVWVVASVLLSKVTDYATNDAQTGMANPTRLEYIKKQEEILSSYKKLEDGNFQIPIEKAMELVVEEQAR